VQADVYVWCYALLVVLARKDEEEDCSSVYRTMQYFSDKAFRYGTLPESQYSTESGVAVRPLKAAEETGWSSTDTGWPGLRHRQYHQMNQCRSNCQPAHNISTIP